MNQRRQAFRRIIKRRGRPLTCPLCNFKFSFRRYFKGRCCPKCKVPVGFSLGYRVVLTSVGLVVVGKIVYTALLTRSFVGVMLSMVLGLVVALAVQAVIFRKFPPKLQAHAEGQIWLRLR